MASRILEGRGVKRPATYVPAWCRAELHKLSKADLMEIAFDYAVRTVGEDAGEVAAYDELCETARILSESAGRKSPGLRKGERLISVPPLPRSAQE